jgi:hypothetical protein
MFHLLATTKKEWKVKTSSLNSTLAETVSKLGFAINVRHLTVCGTDADKFVEHEL